MAPTANRFTPAFEQFAAAMTVIHFDAQLASRAEKVLVDRADIEVAAVSKITKAESALFLGAALSAKVPQPNGSEAEWYVIGRKNVPISEYKAAVHRNIRALNALCVARAFEETERFFRGFGADFFYTHRAQLQGITLPSRDHFEKTHSKLRSQRNQRGYFASYVQYLCRRNCNELIKLYEKHVAGFSNTARLYLGVFDLLQMFQTVGLCRHAIVHNGSVLTKGDVQQVDDVEKALLRQMTGGTRDDTDFKSFAIQPAHELVELVVELLTALGACLYRCASEQFNMKPEGLVLPEKGGKIEIKVSG